LGKIEGHGLGLSIVRRIAEKLDGRVGVESQPGAGSTFYFILPAADSHHPTHNK
jgi:signal transduction histidine kinase